MNRAFTPSGYSGAAAPVVRVASIVAAPLFCVVVLSCKATTDERFRGGGGGSGGERASGGTGGVSSGVGGAGGSSDSGRDASGSLPIPTPFQSCIDLPRTCGPNGDDDCCASPLVPGGTFYRSYDGVTYTDMSNPATVSDFRMDKYEITVGRYRKFREDPARERFLYDGAGRNPNTPDDPGWDHSWVVGLETGLNCGEGSPMTEDHDTWTDTVGQNENFPMNCINWFEAFAFCIWDGGRLPTEAEWNYAAAGAGEQRVHPWSNPPTDTTRDDTYAVFPYADGGGPWPSDVGSKSPRGDGKWGHSDLEGNVAAEWIADYYGPYPNPCTDCINLAEIVEMVPYGRITYGRVTRGSVCGRDHSSPMGSGSSFNGVFRGARCVRAP